MWPAGGREERLCYVSGNIDLLFLKQNKNWKQLSSYHLTIVAYNFCCLANLILNHVCPTCYSEKTHSAN